MTCEAYEIFQGRRNGNFVTALPSRRYARPAAVTLGKRYREVVTRGCQAISLADSSAETRA